jgi:hypothetical protein
MSIPQDQLQILKSKYPERIENHKGKPPYGYIADATTASTIHANYERLHSLDEAFDRLDNGESTRVVAESIPDLNKSMLHRLWKKHRPNSQRNYDLRKEKKTKLQARRERIAKAPEAVRAALKEELKKKDRVKRTKIKLAKAKESLEKLLGETEKVVEKRESYEKAFEAPVILKGEFDTEVVEKVSTEREVVFKPNTGPQEDFLAASELEVLYGGAAGGGKSYALIADPMRYFDNPNFNGLLIRRTNDELREIIWNTKKLYPKAFPKATFGEKSSEWRFPSGGRLWISYLDRDDDVLRYHGQAFTWIGFDELTQYPTSFAWDYLRSRLRTTDPALKKTLAMRGTTNPGGPGHGWVKRMFVDPAPAGEAFWATDIDTGKVMTDPETGQPLFKRRFIPAKLKDNPFLYDDGIYRMNLMSLSEMKRAQLLDGDWTMADGAAFPEFRVSKHVVEPFDIPSNWSRFRAADYGYASYSCVLWFAIDPMDEQLVVYRELYVSNYTGEALAATVMDLEKAERVSYGMLDSSVWHKRGEGPSIAEVMIQKGCRWRPSDRSAGSRVAGKNRLHELLKIDQETGRPGIVFFKGCRQVISDLQVIPSDPHGDDDIDSRYKSDHSYDALRYGIMSRPRSVPWWMQQSEHKVIAPVDRVFGY